VTAVAHKVMLLGAIGVGKSSLAQRLVFDRFDTAYKPTIGVDVYRYEVESADGTPPMPMIVWDSDGNLGEAMFRHVYLKEASAAIIIADCSRRDTIAAMPGIATSFRERLPGRSVCFILNKVDLLADPDVIELPVELTGAGTKLYRTSAMTGENVKRAFADTARTIARRSS
jgi:small GTP-binding protein